MIRRPIGTRHRPVPAVPDVFHHLYRPGQCRHRRQRHQGRIQPLQHRIGPDSFGFRLSLCPVPDLRRLDRRPLRRAAHLVRLRRHLGHLDHADGIGHRPASRCLPSAWPWDSARARPSRRRRGPCRIGLPTASAALPKALPTPFRDSAMPSRRRSCAALMIALSWRGAFVVLGACSLLWVLVWVWYFRDDPHQHKGVTAADLALLPPSDKARDRQQEGALGAAGLAHPAGHRDLFLLRLVAVALSELAAVLLSTGLWPRFEEIGAVRLGSVLRRGRRRYPGRRDQRQDPAAYRQYQIGSPVGDSIRVAGRCRSVWPWFS